MSRIFPFIYADDSQIYISNLEISPLLIIQWIFIEWLPHSKYYANCWEEYTMHPFYRAIL